MHYNLFTFSSDVIFYRWIFVVKNIWNIPFSLGFSVVVYFCITLYVMLWITVKRILTDTYGWYPLGVFHILTNLSLFFVYSYYTYWTQFHKNVWLVTVKVCFHQVIAVFFVIYTTCQIKKHEIINRIRICFWLFSKSWCWGVVWVYSCRLLASVANI